MTKTSGQRDSRLTDLERQIVFARGQRIMLDSDLASLYGVSTAALNQAVARNKERFPDDFAFRLTSAEFNSLRMEAAERKSGRGGRQKLPWAFTEHGVAMLSSVLRSPRAVEVNIEIIRAFVRLRRLFATPGELVSQLNQLAETVQLHDGQIKAIVDVLNRMTAAPPEPPKRKIGFQTDALGRNRLEAVKSNGDAR